jgi:hypothetical protein
MTVDRDIIGRISEHQPGRLAVHQFDVGGLVARIRANELVITEQPKVAKPGNGFGLLLRDDVAAVGLRRCGRAIDQNIDFCRLKTSDLKVEVEVERRELFQVELQDFEVPSRV